jgi:Rrf2 family protein
MNTVLRVSQATSLAVHTMALLSADRTRPRSAKDIAAVLHVSEAHLAKVLQRLVRERLVTSTRGPRGGFELAAGAQSAPLMAVWEAMEGRFVDRPPCLFEAPLCEAGTCIFGDLIKKINDELRRYLTDTRISEVKGAFSGPVARRGQKGEGGR